MDSCEIISEVIEEDLKRLDQNLHKLLSENLNDLTANLSLYLFSKSKRIRSTLAFLFSKTLCGNVFEEQISIASASELIHNATLIHDDIIDNAPVRRGLKTINFEFDNKLAVLAGDFLLSLALDELFKIETPDVLKIFTSTLKEVCNGEINQYFSKNKIPTMEGYIKRSRQKTALLFEATLCSITTTLQPEHTKKIQTFAQNFGIAFQIKDDLENILSNDKSKPVLSDIKNGIYTAPIIFLNEEYPMITECSEEEILDKLNQSNAIKKTRELIKNYITGAIDSLDFLPHNHFKQCIIKICNNIINEDI